MRINLTKKDIVNSLYMQIGFSKKISENLLEDVLSNIIDNLKANKKVKISNFGTFSIYLIISYEKKPDNKEHMGGNCFGVLNLNSSINLFKKV